MKLDSLKELYVHELNDLHSAEDQILRALPRMARASSSPDLRLAFERHFDETEEHIERLERVFSSIGEKPKRGVCKGMRGLLQESEDMVKEDGDPAVKDAGLIAAAQRVEHYEMAGYGCARTYAEMLGEMDSAELLQKTLDEERMTDVTLTELAEGLINVEAAQA